MRFVRTPFSAFPMLVEEDSTLFFSGGGLALMPSDAITVPVIESIAVNPGVVLGGDPVWGSPGGPVSSAASGEGIASFPNDPLFVQQWYLFDSTAGINV